MSSFHFLRETVSLQVTVADPECSRCLKIPLYLDLKVDLVLGNIGQHVGPEVEEEDVPVLGGDGETHLLALRRKQRRDPTRGSLGYCTIRNFVEVNLKFKSC